jgi:hypothetical protein
MGDETQPSMKPLAEMYRDGLIRAIVTERPAMLFQVSQPTVLADYCNLLADCAEAKRLLRANGHGLIGMSVLEMVQQLLATPAAPPPAPARKRKRKR